MSAESVLSIELSETALRGEHQRLCSALGTGVLAPEAFDASAYSAEVLAEARAFWRARMASEHRSVGVFLELSRQLIEANAPLDAKTVMLRLAQDELRHTEICGVVLRALGETPSLSRDSRVAPLARHAGCGLEERALRNVLYASCLSEMVAAARLVDALEHTTDPLARAATRAVLADEVMHGRFGFLYLEASQGYLAAHPDVRGSLAEYLRHAFAVLERELAGAALARAHRPSPAAQALGVLDPRRAREVFYGTIEAAVVPALEQQGLDAGRAWRERRVAAAGGEQ